MAVYETSRDYARPHRPLLIRAYNALGRGPRLDAGELIETAMRREKLETFASEAFREALDRLLEALESEAALSPMGRFMTRTHLLSALANNLRAGAWFARHEELRTRAIARPVMICGLGRSGTTLLQRMLAELPGARALATWEALEPVPPLDWQREAPREADPRVRQIQRAEGFVRWLSPDLFTVHPMSAWAPEEEVLLIDQLCRSNASLTAYDIPSFAAWLEAQDQTVAYRWLRDLLALLEWQRGGDFWLLKSPHHLDWLDTIFEVFPDIQVIQTHRDPVETVPSFCSLVAHSWGLMSDRVDPHAAGRQWLDKSERMTSFAMKTRDRREGAGFVDVFYRELLDDPLAVVERLCTQLDLPWDEAIREHLRGWLADHPQHKTGIHRYAAEDFGLSAEQIADRLSAYRERFDLAR